ncbi:MAG TPA: hypothetical protein DD473_17990 [Planctomycetaceae bacterium]|nr:hypothetical protein [Planctomycetaceae bacterium]
MKVCLLPLLIFAILVCPYRCMSVIASHSYDEGVNIQKTCCCCSQKSTSESSDKSPSSPENNDSCSNCLCHGAVVTADNFDLDVAGMIDVIASLQLILSLQLSAVEDCRGHWNESPPGSPLSGLTLCIQHQSLLI